MAGSPRTSGSSAGSRSRLFGLRRRGASPRRRAISYPPCPAQPRWCRGCSATCSGSVVTPSGPKTCSVDPRHPHSRHRDRSGHDPGPGARSLAGGDPRQRQLSLPGKRRGHDPELRSMVPIGIGPARFPVHRIPVAGCAGRPGSAVSKTCGSCWPRSIGHCTGSRPIRTIRGSTDRRQ